MKKDSYFVKGMHCASCEIIIEKELLSIDGVIRADASLAKSVVDFEYEKDKPSLKRLNAVFASKGYVFSEEPFKEEESSLKPVFIALVFIIIFLVFSISGILPVAGISAASSLPAVFIFGLIAGVSSCAALVGGLVLSLAKQWSGLYGEKKGLVEKAKPHLIFNAGRLFSYAVFGAVLGSLGAGARISPIFSSVVICVVSLSMFILAMQMIGVKAFERIRIALPKSIASKIKVKDEKKGRWYPFIIGFLTILLPCGFTVIAEGAAVLSGSALRGALLMASFALGTSLSLIVIGISSSRVSSKSGHNRSLAKAAGMIIIFFVLYNLNLQFGIIRPLT